MCVFTGLLLGIGLFLCLSIGHPSFHPEQRPRLHPWLAETQLPKVRPVHLVLASAGGALVAGALVLPASSTWSVAVVFAAFGAATPWLLLRRRVIRRRHERRDLWPYVIEDLASGIRAGLSLSVVVVDASAVFLARRSLASEADGASVAAAQAVSKPQVYANGAGARLLLSEVQAAVANYAGDDPSLQASVEHGADGDTVVVTGHHGVSLPFVGFLGVGPVTVTATSGASSVRLAN
jgi:hypothetical protein